MSIDKGPCLTHADTDQFKADALVAATALDYVRAKLSEQDQAAIKRFYRYLEADSWLPLELVN